jgi:hypothetical protein
MEKLQKRNKVHTVNIPLADSMTDGRGITYGEINKLNDRAKEIGISFRRLVAQALKIYVAEFINKEDK